MANTIPRLSTFSCLIDHLDNIENNDNHCCRGITDHLHVCHILFLIASHFHFSKLFIFVSHLNMLELCIHIICRTGFEIWCFHGPYLSRPTNDHDFVMDGWIFDQKKFEIWYGMIFYDHQRWRLGLPLGASEAKIFLCTSLKTLSEGKK